MTQKCQKVAVCCNFLPQTAQTDADPFSAQTSEFYGKMNYRITFVNTGALSFSTVT